MKRFLQLALGLVLCAAPLVAQNSAPDIAFDSSADLLKLPDNIHMGEAAGVATNSKGHIFVYTRTGEPGRAGGPGGPGGEARGGAPAEAGRGAGAAGGQPPAGGGGGGGGRGPAGPPGSGIPGDSFVRTAGVAWDKEGNIYIADGVAMGAGNARVAKFDRDAHFIKSWGQRGSEPGQFNSLRGIALDAQGNVYVADAGNKRIQVFDGDGNPKSQITNIGTPYAMCMTSGPHQYLYTSNSNDPETLDNGEIYKLELDGRIVGKFGRAGRLPKEFNMVNAIECRSENELLVGELGNWRVQKVTLRAAR